MLVPPHLEKWGYKKNCSARCARESCFVPPTLKSVAPPMCAFILQTHLPLYLCVVTAAQKVDKCGQHMKLCSVGVSAHARLYMTDGVCIDCSINCSASCDVFAVQSSIRDSAPRILTLRAKLSGAVYCNRSCLWVCLFVYLCMCVWGGGSVTTITRNCVHRSSSNWVCR